MSACVYKCINAAGGSVRECRHKLFFGRTCDKVFKIQDRMSQMTTTENATGSNSADMFWIGLKKTEWAEVQRSRTVNN